MSDISQEVQGGVEELEYKAALKRAGMDESSEGADNFKAGWKASREVANLSPEEIQARMKNDFGNLPEDQRQAYIKGYATGSEK